MDSTPTVKGIIFDFDGLIIDSESVVFHTWQRLYSSYDLDLKMEDWAEIIGRSDQDRDPMVALAHAAGKGFKEEETRKDFDKELAEEMEKTDVFPGVREVIADAKEAGLKLAIASSSSRSWVEEHLQRFQLCEYFDVIVSSDDVKKAKPDPKIYALAVQELALNPKQVMVFEDSPAGVLAAKRASLFCIAVPNQMTRSLSFEDDGHQPDMRIDSLKGFDLDPFLERPAPEEGS
ncbi:MAG: HAD-IA family hydrolase [Anaerolineales bacterium]|nr:HAD-IA family hydrolase [Anaerolineales bacterium]